MPHNLRTIKGRDIMAFTYLQASINSLCFKERTLLPFAFLPILHNLLSQLPLELAKMKLAQYLVNSFLPLLITAIPIHDTSAAVKTPGYCAYNGSEDVHTVASKECCAPQGDAYWSLGVLRCTKNGGPIHDIYRGPFDACCNSKGTHAVYKW